MDTKDEKLVNTKTLDGFDQSTPSCAVKEETRRLDLTNLASMGAKFSKSQENGSGVSEEESVRDNSIDGGTGGGSVGVGEGGGVDASVSEELPFRKNVGDDEELGEKSTVDDGEMGKENKEIKFGGKKDAISNGDVGIDDKPSSIARRTRNRAKLEDMEDLDIDLGQKGSKVVDEDEEENPFSVGDFVWGKIKSHPWWPGRIYDPLDASEFALKYRHEGRLLVAYFGDRTFAWCDPSQLKPFIENFEEMSKQSSLKTFVSAVMEAENEIGTLVKLQLTCSCAKAKESQRSLPFVVNGGVKEGIHVPENGFSVFSVDQFNPSALLADIKRFATFDSLIKTVERTVLKSQLLAFYHAKFGYSLPMCCEPVSIEDPMDKGGVPLEASFRGPEDGVTPFRNAPKTPLDVPQKGRKSRSISELLGIGTGNDLEESNMDKTEGETPIRKSVVKSRKKSQRVSDEDNSSMREAIGDDSVSKDVDQSGKLVAKSGRRKRKTMDENETHVVTRSSARRKIDASGRSIESEKKASVDAEVGSETKKQKKTHKIVKERKKNISLCINGGPTVEEGYERISPREKKLSKYLSPPYTIQLQRQRSSCSETGSDQAGGLVYSDVAKMDERMVKTAGKLVGSPPLVKCSGQTFQKSSKAPSSKREKTYHSNQKTSQPDPSSEVDTPMESVGSLNGMLREIRSAACSPLSSKRDQSFDSMKGFLCSYKNSNYIDGTNYSSYKKKRARNLSGTKHVSDQEVLKEADQRTSKSKPVRSSAAKREAKLLESKAEDDLSCGPSSSSAALLITFPAGFSMPTKEDIIEICGKFGDLDESETEVVAKSSMAKIVFVQSSCAEAAMKSMKKSVPFGSSKVGYKIQHPTDVPMSKGKKVDVQNKKKMKISETSGGAKSPGKPSAASAESEPLAVIFIKQKLESMTQMLANTDGIMSQEIKSNLESEVKDLLKKVKMMTASSSS